MTDYRVASAQTAVVGRAAPEQRVSVGQVSVIGRPAPAQRVSTIHVTVAGPYVYVPPAGPTLSLWNGVTEEPLTLEGVWDGASVVAATIELAP